MAALFSCTKCHKRYPFEELSQGEQLCKDCRNNFPVVKCTYCRAEFQQNSKGSTSSICAKCAQNVKHFGKPTACENCSVLAAFIGKRCQRCVNSEKKWGPPLVCEQCKLKCAFDRPERRKVNGKLMCWLCDQAYKRVLAKTRKTQDMVLKSSGLSSSSAESPSKLNSSANNGQNLQASQPVPSSASFEGMTVLERLTKLATSGGSSRGNTPPVDIDRPVKVEGESRLAEKPQSSSDDAKSGEGDKEEKPHRHHHNHRKYNHHHHHSHSKRHLSKEDEEAGDAKKPKPEKNQANGVAAAAVSTPKSTGSNMSDPGVDTTTSENVILITQLREQIESIKKQIASKDQQLLEKDKKITELKAHMYENDKKFRSKITAMQQSHSIALETLQIKNRELTRQVASLSKSKKTTETTTLSLTAL